MSSITVYKVTFLLRVIKFTAWPGEIWKTCVLNIVWAYWVLYIELLKVTQAILSSTYTTWKCLFTNPSFWVIRSRSLKHAHVWPVSFKACLPFWIIQSFDGFDNDVSALSLARSQVFSLYKHDTTRMVGRLVNSSTTHTSLWNTHVIFKQYHLHV